MDDPILGAPSTSYAEPPAILQPPPVPHPAPVAQPLPAPEAPPAPPPPPAPPASGRMKVRMKRPVAMPEDYVSTDAALLAMRGDEKIKPKRQRVSKDGSRSATPSSLQGGGQGGDITQVIVVHKPARGGRSGGSEHREGGSRRSTPIPPDAPAAPVSVDLATLLSVKDRHARRWSRQWVEVKSGLGGRVVRLLRWVPEGPPQVPRLTARPMVSHSTKMHRAASGDSLSNISRDAKAIAATLAAEFGGGGGAAAAGAGLDNPAPMVPCTFPGCKKVFPSITSMRKHAHMHSEKTFACNHPGCTKAFVDASKLKRHMMSHATEKPFHCPIPGCGKDFSLHFNLKTHLKVVHPGVPLPPPDAAAPAAPRDSSRTSSPLPL